MESDKVEVIGSHGYPGLLMGVSNGIQTGINSEFHTAHTPPGLDTSETIGPHQRGGDPGDPSRLGLNISFHK